MKIFDCFMYFDEEIVLDLRLNVLNNYVDYFVIVESSYTHKGDKRDLKFNHRKFEKFKDKIIYLIYDFSGSILLHKYHVELVKQLNQYGENLFLDKKFWIYC